MVAGDVYNMVAEFRDPIHEELPIRMQDLAYISCEDKNITSELLRYGIYVGRAFFQVKIGYKFHLNPHRRMIVAIYNVRCRDCGHTFEVQQSMNAPLPPCEKCSSLKVEKLVSKSTFALKGSGWYRDGY